MKVCIRVDASLQMGSGHVMRCLTLADEIKRLGGEATFITRAHPGWMDSAIKRSGHEVVLLSAPTADYLIRQDDVTHASWLGVAWEQDAKETTQAIGTSRPDWLIVDHYSIDSRWHKELRDHVGQIMVIDDLADHQLDCDMLLDQTYGRKEEDYKQWVSSSCQMILGSHYALLRPRFAKLRPKAIEKRKKFNGINRILISMGGVDADNVTAKVLKEIAKISWKSEPIIDVVMGDKAPHLNEVIKQAEELPLEIIVSTNVFDMAERMLQADLAFGAAGATSWERCCLGLPTLVSVSAENQKMVSTVLDGVGAIRLLNDGMELCDDDIKNDVNRFTRSPSYWRNMSQAAFQVTDGLGTKRVALEFSQPCAKDGKPIRLKRITLEDADLIFSWQSDPRTRRYFKNREIPAYKQHISWVKSRVNNILAYTEIILYEDKPAGIIRLDPVMGVMDGKRVFMVSIYVAPDKYGLGIGKATLEIINKLMSNFELRAEVHKDNIASKKVFENAGFVSTNNSMYIKTVIDNFEKSI